MLPTSMIDADKTIVRNYEASRKRKLREKKKELPAIGMDVHNTTNEVKSKQLASYFHTHTRDLAHNDKQDVLQKNLQHPTMQGLVEQIMPENPMLQRLLSNLRSVFQSMGKSNDEVVLKRGILMMLLNSSTETTSSYNIGQLSKVLGVSRKILYDTIDRVKLNTGSVPSSLMCPRKLRSTSITSEIRLVVQTYWSTQTRVSPNKKDVCRKRISPNVYEEHPIHILEVPQSELFLQFKETYPEVRIQLRSFELMKPYFVRKLKDRYTCCCIYHVQMSFLKDAVNQIRTKAFGVHDEKCTCTCLVCQCTTGGQCSSECYIFKSIYNIIESVLCPRNDGATGFHQYKCVMGNCQECGAHKFGCCPKEVSSGTTISVKVFEDVDAITDGKIKKRKDVVKKDMTCTELLSLFKTKLHKFIQHNFIYLWQAEQFKECLLNFPNDVCVSVVDFAENYAFKEQNEIQSMHWWSMQVTIFVHITYIRIDGEVKKTIHFFISDDKKHDTLFVQHCFKLQWQWLKEQGVVINHHWVWSDGAASQFKAKRPFFHIGRYRHLTGIGMIWNFFGSGHGKGEHDGAGAVIKRGLTHEQLKKNGAELKCAADVVKFSRANLSRATACYPSTMRDINRVFWEVKVGEVDRSNNWDCQSIPQTRFLHCVRGYSKTNGRLIATRQLSCYCCECIQGLWRCCKNKSHVSNWDYHTITPLNDTVEADDEVFEDFTYEGNPDVLSDALQIGDTFAVNAEEDNDECADFYLLKCINIKQYSYETMVDDWNNAITAGSYFVEGRFYEKIDENCYKLMTKSPTTFIYSHLIRCIKIPLQLLQPCTELYMLPTGTFEAVYNSMPWDV